MRLHERPFITPNNTAATLEAATAATAIAPLNKRNSERKISVRNAMASKLEVSLFAAAIYFLY